LKFTLSKVVWIWVRDHLGGLAILAEDQNIGLGIHIPADNS
jgi:hypothetical protein